MICLRSHSTWQSWDSNPGTSAANLMTSTCTLNSALSSRTGSLRPWGQAWSPSPRQPACDLFPPGPWTTPDSVSGLRAQVTSASSQLRAWHRGSTWSVFENEKTGLDSLPISETLRERHAWFFGFFTYERSSPQEISVPSGVFEMAGATKELLLRPLIEFYLKILGVGELCSQMQWGWAGEEGPGMRWPEPQAGWGSAE